MKANDIITLDQWMKDLARVQEGQTGFTSTEFSVALHIGAEKARRVIKLLIQAHKVVPAPLSRINMSGIATTVKGYKFMEERNG